METSWRERPRYRIDEFFARGTITLILSLVVAEPMKVRRRDD
ncbi:MAG TPA: hypothetical protein VNL94_05930 [Candidatus Binatia bacterium]|nr:hypothetical protein [Candidatus Binatia bacterium]